MIPAHIGRGSLSVFLRKLHAEQASEQGAKKISRNTEYKPNKREGETYLSEQIEREIGIIPHIPSENEIDCHAAQKFDHCNEQRAVDPPQEAGRAAASTVDQIDARKAEAAAKKHAEMRIAAPQDLNQKIQNPARGKQKA